MPDRLVEVLMTLDQTGVYEPLRYDIPLGRGYVADGADELRQWILEQLSEDER